eukprot:1705360-Ditylum_brightwellii.AAC.1
MFEESAHGATFVSLDQVHQVLLAILGFVDDANNQVNEFHNNDMTIERLLSLFNKIVNSGQSFFGFQEAF